jgi:hypothetical protein
MSGRGSPAQETRLRMANAHTACDSLDSNLQQFPMNARRTQARVGVAHLTDEIANFRRFCRAAIAMPTFPSPIKPKPLAMPPDDGGREFLPAERRGIASNLGGRKAKRAWFGKVTGRDSINATISMRTDFLVGTVPEMIAVGQHV